MSSLWTTVVVVAIASGAACSDAAPMERQPLHVFASNGVGALLEDAQPELERAAGRPIAFEFSTAVALQRRIEQGERPDVAVLTSAIVDALAARRILSADSTRSIARAGVGVGIRAGAPAVDVRTPDALRSFLLGARSVTFTAEGQSRVAIDTAFERLGIVEPMRLTSVLRGPGEAPGAVVDGASDVVLTLLSEMVGVPGLTVLGPLPPELQRYVTFAAARSAGSPDAAAADRLLQAFASVVVTARLARYGLETVPAS